MHYQSLHVVYSCLEGDSRHLLLPEHPTDILARNSCTHVKRAFRPTSRLLLASHTEQCPVSESCSILTSTKLLNHGLL